MTLSKFLILAAVLALLPLRSLADTTTTVRSGVDLTHYKNQTSIYSIGVQDLNRDGFGWKLEAGAWTDSGQDRKGSFFTSAMGAKRFGDLDGFNLTGLFGIIVASNADGALGSPLAFTEEAILGYRAVGIGYKHISNAGLWVPNHGRDYLSVTVSFRW